MYINYEFIINNVSLINIKAYCYLLILLLLRVLLKKILFLNVSHL